MHNSANSNENSHQYSQHQAPSYDVGPGSKVNDNVNALQRVFEKNICVYATSSAVTVVATQTRSDDFATLTVEGAKVFPYKARLYDWKNKISFQFTRTELPYFIGVLVGMISEAEFKNHGAQHNKSLKLVRQKNHFFINVSEKGNNLIALPICFDDALSISMYAIDVYMRNFSNLSDTLVLKLIAKSLKKA